MGQKAGSFYSIKNKGHDEKKQKVSDELEQCRLKNKKGIKYKALSGLCIWELAASIQCTVGQAEHLQGHKSKFQVPFADMAPRIGTTASQAQKCYFHAISSFLYSDFCSLGFFSPQWRQYWTIEIKLNGAHLIFFSVLIFYLIFFEPHVCVLQLEQSFSLITQSYL